jgi:hypothetical protein
MRWPVVVFALALLVEACGFVEVGPEDRGRLQRGGVELRPESLPWDVAISPHVEQSGVIYDAFRSLNEQFSPLEMFRFVFFDNIYTFERMAYRPLEARGGTVFVFQGFAGTPGESSVINDTFVDQWATTRLAWTEHGEIFAGEITISANIAYDAQTVRDVVKHEAGHTLGLDHDDRSQDSRSCMSAPPAYDCRLTPGDARLVKGE